jgi:hypothetical protein
MKVTDEFFITHALFFYKNLDLTFKKSCKLMKSLLQLNKINMRRTQDVNIQRESLSYDSSCNGHQEPEPTSSAVAHADTDSDASMVATSILPGTDCHEKVLDDKSQDINSDDDIEIINDTTEGSQLPHLRPDCSVHPFRTTPHSSTCAYCWCYICDAPVSSCTTWTIEHCHANPYDKAMVYRWKLMKSAFKKRRADMVAVDAPGDGASSPCEITPAAPAAPFASAVHISTTKNSIKRSRKNSTPSILSYFNTSAPKLAHVSDENEPPKERQTDPQSQSSQQPQTTKLRISAPIVIEILSSPSPPPKSTPTSSDYREVNTFTLNLLKSVSAEVDTTHTASKGLACRKAIRGQRKEYKQQKCAKSGKKRTQTEGLSDASAPSSEIYII